MKRLLLTSLALAALLAPAASSGAPRTYTVLLAGGEEANRVKVWLSEDGRNYVIDSVVQLEVGGTVCANPPDNLNELLCHAPSIAGFEVNAGGGADRIWVAKNVRVPFTMRGGGGPDLLVGGGGPDKLNGGSGADRLVGGRGPDLLLGGPGADVLLGGPGSDVLRGGPGLDRLGGGPGRDDLRQQQRRRHRGARP